MPLLLLHLRKRNVAEFGVMAQTPEFGRDEEQCSFAAYRPLGSTFSALSPLSQQRYPLSSEWDKMTAQVRCPPGTEGELYGIPA